MIQTAPTAQSAPLIDKKFLSRILATPRMKSISAISLRYEQTRPVNAVGARGSAVNESGLNSGVGDGANRCPSVVVSRTLNGITLPRSAVDDEAQHSVADERDGGEGGPHEELSLARGLSGSI